MKTLVLAGLAILILTGGFMLTGCGPHHPGKFFFGSPEKRADWIAKKIARELKLDESQKIKLASIKQDILTHHKKPRPEREQMHDAIKAQLLSDQIDETTLNQLFEQQHENHSGMKKYFISKFAEFHAILTPAQRQKLVGKLEKFHNHFGKFHHDK